MKKTQITSRKNSCKKKKIIVLFLFSFFAFGLFSWLRASAQYVYTPMENIPGFEGVVDFPSYALAISKFAIWTVGIVALFMIIWGGFMYITSAGNTSRLDTAKRIIFDAFYGLIVALGAWLLLYVINPDLVKITLRLGTTPTGAPVITEPGAVGPPPTTAKACPGGSCSQVDQAIANNRYGIEPATLKSIVHGGEGCNSSLSPDGHGSCGYSQALPKIRAWCGIPGTPEESCKLVQQNVQLDIDCAAKLISSDIKRCGKDIRQIASCYNSGKANNCANTTNNYCGRAENYYNNCIK